MTRKYTHNVPLTTLIISLICLLNTATSVESKAGPKLKMSKGIGKFSKNIASEIAMDALINAPEIVRGTYEIANKIQAINKVSHAGGHYSAKLGKYYDQKFITISETFDMMTHQINGLRMALKTAQVQVETHRTVHISSITMFAIFLIFIAVIFVIMFMKMRGSFVEKQIRNLVTRITQKREATVREERIQKQKRQFDQVLSRLEDVET